MKHIKELYELMVELTNEGMDDGDNFKPTKRFREIVNEISDYAEKTEIYQNNKDRGVIFKDATAEEIYGYMLDRVVNAPTSLHMTASILMIIPFLRKKIDGEYEK